MNRPQAFQFYAKDWLSSKKIATMTLEEEGAYIHLLAHCWDSSDCTLPDDDAELAQLSRMGERWVNGGSVKLRNCFVTHPKKPGRLFNARLLEERKKQNAWRKKSQQGGKRSAESRASRSQVAGRVVEGCLKDGSRVVQPKANSSSSSASSSASSKEKKDILRPEARACHSSVEKLNGAAVGLKQFWEAYPKKRSLGDLEIVWAKLQPDDSLLRTMLSKIDQAKRTAEWQKDNGHWIPSPAKWLKAKGWLDDYAQPRPRLAL